MPGSDWTPIELTRGLPPEHADIVIIGGGVIGWSVAYWLKRRLMSRDALRVVLVEKDPTVSHSPGLRVFSLWHLLLIPALSLCFCALSTARPPRCSLQEAFGSSSH